MSKTFFNLLVFYNSFPNPESKSPHFILTSRLFSNFLGEEMSRYFLRTKQQINKGRRIERDRERESVCTGKYLQMR